MYLQIEQIEWTLVLFIILNNIVNYVQMFVSWDFLALNSYNKYPNGK